MAQHNINNYDDIWTRPLSSSYRSHLDSLKKDFTIVEAAMAMYMTDFANIQDFRATSFKHNTVFIPHNGIWLQQHNDNALIDICNRFSVIIRRALLDRISILLETFSQRKDITEDLTEAVKLKYAIFSKLNNYISGSQQKLFINAIIHRIVMSSKDTGFIPEHFNRATEYIAFADGVYSFQRNTIIPHKEAYNLLITQHCGFDYADVLNVNKSTYDQCYSFISQIIPDNEVRSWLLRRYNRAAASVIEKIILILHGPKGNNGKTKFLDLLEKTFGRLFCKCGSALLAPEASSSKSKPNEDLMSTKNSLIIAFSEPDKNKPLNMSMLKELSGGDPITGRRLYGEKETFYAKALINIACNFIPHMDATDQGAFNRIFAIHFHSCFVTDPKDVDMENNKYLADLSISSYFDTWKFAMMKIILEANQDCPTPANVIQHTQEYRYREDILQHFIKEFIIPDPASYVSLSDLWIYFKSWKKQNEFSQNITSGMFREDIINYLDEANYRKDTVINGKRLKNVFKGFRFNCTDND